MRVRHKSDFRHVPPLLPVLIENGEHNLYDVVVSYGVRHVEQKIIDTDHREEFHVPRDYPRVGRVVIPVQRFAPEMISVDGAILAACGPERVRIIFFEVGNVVNLAARSVRAEPQKVEQTHVARFFAVARESNPSESVHRRNRVAGEFVIAEISRVVNGFDGFRGFARAFRSRFRNGIRRGIPRSARACRKNREGDKPYTYGFL